jgi:DNA-binding NarL/FixJ family response regulator
VCVLVIDDDPSFREAVGELLCARGFEGVGYAQDGDEATAAIQQLRPDAVLLDIRLPGSDGLALARRLSAGHPAPAVLLTSSDPDAANQRLALASGAVGFVPKADLGGTDFERYFAS